MHKYLSAVGFDKYSKKDFTDWLYHIAIADPDIITEAYDLDNNEIIEYRKEVSPGMGICMRGFRDDSGNFVMDSYFPYREPRFQSNELQTNIIPQTDRNGMYGVCDDLRIGVDLVYFVQDMMALLKTEQKTNSDVFFGGTSLIGLADAGKIILPVVKTEEAKQRNEVERQKKTALVLKARSGDEKAYERLSMQEMDLYNEITDRMQRENVYSIIDTSFMPCGVETDKYSVVAEILEIHKFQNAMTKQKILVMLVETESMRFEVAVNENNLLGIPAVGRRFKGDVWLQGKVNA